MHKVPLLLLVLTLVTLLGIGVLSIFLHRNISPAYTGAREKITIGNENEYSIFNIVGQKNGYFRDNGLGARIVE